MKRCPVCGDFDNKDDWCNHCDIPYTGTDQKEPVYDEPEEGYLTEYKLIWLNGDEVILYGDEIELHGGMFLKGMYISGHKSYQEVVIAKSYYETYYNGETVKLPF